MGSHTATTIEETPEALRIVMPVPRMGCAAVFLGVWLVGWLFGEVSAISALIRTGSLLNPAAWFLVVWLAGWTIGGLVAAALLVMMLGGAEVITVTDSELRRRTEAFGRGLDWRYPLGEVANVRVMGDEGSREFVSFDYRDKTIRFGSGLSETNAERVAEAIWARAPHTMPRVERVRREEAAREAQ